MHTMPVLIPFHGHLFNMDSFLPAHQFEHAMLFLLLKKLIFQSDGGISMVKFMGDLWNPIRIPNAHEEVHIFIFSF